MAAEHHAYCSGGTMIFCFHLGQESPKTLQKKYRNPFHGRIESIKTAGKQFQKITSETFPGLFDGKKFSVEFLFRDMPSDGQIHLNLHRDGCYFVLIPSPILSLTRNRDSGGRFRHEF